jgi:hypothetical protein
MRPEFQTPSRSVFCTKVRDKDEPACSLYCPIKSMFVRNKSTLVFIPRVNERVCLVCVFANFSIKPLFDRLPAKTSVVKFLCFYAFAGNRVDVTIHWAKSLLLVEIDGGPLTKLNISARKGLRNAVVCWCVLVDIGGKQLQ